LDVTKSRALYGSHSKAMIQANKLEHLFRKGGGQKFRPKATKMWQPHPDASRAHEWKTSKRL